MNTLKDMVQGGASCPVANRVADHHSILLPLVYPCPRAQRVAISKKGATAANRVAVHPLHRAIPCPFAPTLALTQMCASCTTLCYLVLSCAILCHLVLSANRSLHRAGSGQDHPRADAASLPGAHRLGDGEARLAETRQEQTNLGLGLGCGVHGFVNLHCAFARATGPHGCGARRTCR